VEIVDFFFGRLEELDQEMSDLADQKFASNNRQRALGQLEDKFKAMAADGYIDSSEMKELVAGLKAQGLKTSEIEALFQELRGSDTAVRVDQGAGEKFADLINSTFKHAEQAADDDDFMLNFTAQQKMGEQAHITTAATNVLKKKHEAYMAAINNMKA
jgi:hypothetical protein